MKLNDFDYNLPKNLIAQYPVRPRDYSRLLVLNKKSGKIEHKYFYDIYNYLEKGDVLVLNNSKVFPARLMGKKMETGGKIEVFLLKKIDLTFTPLNIINLTGRALSLPRRGSRTEVWQCLIGGHGRKEGMKIEFKEKLKAEILKNNKDGTWLVDFNKKEKKMMAVINKIGETPLPPYIKQGNNKTKKQENKLNYQTVYADNKKIGSVAAPTAGFHFTPQLMKKLKKKGVEFVYVTLHVGLGTFAPVKTDNIKKHKMHSEWIEIKKEVLEKIMKAKKENRRVFAVGTTSVRTIESVYSLKTECHSRPAVGGRNLEKNKKRFWIPDQARDDRGKMRDFSGWTDIFIYPGYKFKIIGGLITNFHLPKSTLLMLVSALAGKKNIAKAYQEAIKKQYRFFSYGDAMLIT